MHPIVLITLLHILGQPMLNTLHYVGIREGLPPYLLENLIYEESRGKAKSVGPICKDDSRSLGLCQLNSRYLIYLAVKYYSLKFDVFNPIQNATVAARYLHDLYRYFGSWDIALNAYNFGPTNIINNVLLPIETIRYTEHILY